MMNLLVKVIHVLEFSNLRYIYCKRKKNNFVNVDTKFVIVGTIIWNQFNSQRTWKERNVIKEAISI